MIDGLMALSHSDIRPVYITRAIPQAACELLQRHGLAFDMQEGAGTAADLRRDCAGRRAVICQVVDRIDSALIGAISGTCKIIATVSVGFDHIDLAAACRAGVIVTHTPDVLTETTADLTWALLMAAARRLGEAERDLRGGRWSGWGLMQYWGADVYGSTLGIVGGGRIGSAVARRATGFNMRVLCATRRPDGARMPVGTQFVELAVLLREADFVSMHVPLTDQTRHMIGALELRQMKSTAIIVNTSRGPVIDEAALVGALRDRRIAGAGLDVYEHEPRISAGLLELENVVLLPHIGSASRATREKMACMAAESVADVLSGRAPKHPL